MPEPRPDEPPTPRAVRYNGGMTAPGSPDVADPAPRGDAALLREVADRLEALAARTTPGDWRLAGLLASRPEVVASGPDGGTEHVAEARTRSAAWIAALSPAAAAPLAAWLRAAADGPVPPAAVAVARQLADRLP
ncbi:hypothetical protein [Blastococcus sp. VKM Ac-2987]|uniref:hypothetical protein n=1 Tax=Blastococcus sp. VKM Ac-2987 TaxID=3004141 RepID=UPI0022AB7567|nr:hypothetical protein [Blastococcus sp. VKM Ac-2987]MCZ2860051.1 hypothetical protein [Blastococcus sp. VKM Ac-2987]